MSLATSSPLLNAQIILTIIKGDQRGTAFSFDKEKFKIGRDIENEVNLVNDSKVSRIHAQIVQKDQQFFIKNLSETNAIFINNEKLDIANLKNGDRLKIGDTEFSIQIQVVPSGVLGDKTVLKSLEPLPSKVSPPATQVPKKHQVQPMGETPFSSSAPLPHQFKSESPKLGSADNLNINPFYIIIGVLVVAGIWLFKENETIQSKKKLNLRSQEQIAQEMEISQKNIEDEKDRKLKAGEVSIQYQSAQNAYLKGFRDYRQGQYAQAMHEFRAALTYYSDHQMAKRYYNLAKIKFDQLIQFNMIQGRKYLERKNFRLCSNSFEKVMVMIKDEGDLIFKEAKQFKSECDSKLKGRY